MLLSASATRITNLVSAQAAAEQLMLEANFQLKAAGADNPNPSSTH